MSKKDQILEDESPQEPDAGPSSFFPETGPGLAKEVKIGLAVLLGLLTVFGAVVVKKWRRPADPPAVADGQGAKAEEGTGDKTGPKPPPFGGPGAKPAEPTFLAGKAGSTTLSSDSAPKWNPAGDNARPKDPGSEGRTGSAPPSFMPRSPSFASGPSSDPSARPAGVERAAPPPQFNDVVSGNSPRSNDSAFDPLPRQSSPSGLGNSATMVQVGNTPGSSALASGNDGRQGLERHPRHGTGAAPTGTTLATRDITDLSAATPQTMAPPPGAGTSLAADPRFAPRVPPPDSNALPPMPNFGSSSPGAFRPGSESLAASSRVGTAPTNFGRADMPPATRSLDSGPGLQPDGTYRIQPTDNYSTISKKIYGTDGYFRALAEHNRNKFPDENRLIPGETISAPSAAELERNYPRLCSKLDASQSMSDRAMVSNVSVRGASGPRAYVVQEGDNLFNIAKYELNNATRWVEIYELNRDLLGSQVDRLKPGMRLTLPDAPGPSPRTAGRDSGVRR